MMLFVKNNDLSNKLTIDLNSLLIRIDTHLWMGQVTIRICEKIKELSINYNANIFLCIINKAFSECQFFKISNFKCISCSAYEVFLKNIDLEDFLL
jgi:hypothetical protein